MRSTPVATAPLAGAAPASPLRRRLAEIAGYLGGALVVAAGLVFLADRWDELRRGEQVLLLAAIAAVLLGVGAGLALSVRRAVRGGLTDGWGPRDRLAGVLLTAGVGSAAFAVSLHLDDPGTHDSLPVLAGALVMAALSAGGYLLVRGLVGQLGTLVGALVAVTAAVEELQADEVATGVALLALGLGWLGLAERGAWREVTAARAAGVAVALLGAQVPTFGADQAWVGYLLTFALAGAGFAVYLVRAAWPYLALGVAGITLAAPEALLDWTDGAMGPAGVLLAAGLALLAGSVVGLRLRRR